MSKVKDNSSGDEDEGTTVVDNPLANTVGGGGGGSGPTSNSENFLGSSLRASRSGGVDFNMYEQLPPGGDIVQKPRPSVTEAADTHDDASITTSGDQTPNRSVGSPLAKNPSSSPSATTEEHRRYVDPSLLVKPGEDGAGGKLHPTDHGAGNYPKTLSASPSPAPNDVMRMRGASLFQGPSRTGSVAPGMEGGASTPTTSRNSFSQQQQSPRPQQQQQGVPNNNSSMFSMPSSANSRVAIANSSMANGSMVSPSQGQQPQAVPPPDKRTIAMEFGDEYTGEVTLLRGSQFSVPHGQGTLHSVTGGHSYVGDFKLRLRDGLGKLVTNAFFLWCKWKDNRPDWSASVRIDYTNGEKYSGYLAAVTDPAAQAKLRKDKTPLSKFSQWVQTTILIRERWGEIVFPNGSRYFGQWDANQPDGFGCALLENGDRYIGNWWKGKYHGAGTLFSSKKSKRLTGGGLVYDGIWEKGVFDAEEGHVTFPCRTRLTGEWKNSVQADTASVYHATRQDTGRRWLNSFQWETLLCGAQGSSKTRDINAAVPLKCLIQKAQTKEEVETHCKRLIKENASIGNSLKIFRRCFYFLYGTCGVSSEIGAGLGNNKLGWCHVRGQYGGCIHRGRGKVITSSDVDAALGDISSFVMSLRRWIDELVGENGSQAIYDWDADVPVTRHLLDIVLGDVHQPLFNLYIQTYRKEQVGLTAALNRLSNITADDLGVVFGRQLNEERLFSPYEDAIRSLQNLSKASSLNGKLNCLKKMSHDIDISTRLGQMSLDGAELSKLSSFITNRRETHGESLHAMASPKRGGGGGGGQQGPSNGLQQQSTNNHGGDDEQHAAMAPLISQALAVQSGSADDLLPIHQYVLMEANIPYLFSHVQMLLDLSADESFVDGTSQDAFCITTLHACTTILPQLHRNITDEKNVITPLAVYEKRIEDSLNFDTDATLDAILAWLPSVLAAMGTVSMPLQNGVEGAVEMAVIPAAEAFRGTSSEEGDITTTTPSAAVTDSGSSSSHAVKQLAVPIGSIVPALRKEKGGATGTAATGVSPAGSTTRAKITALKEKRHHQDSLLIQRYIKQAISVLRAGAVSVFVELPNESGEEGVPRKVVAVDAQKQSSGALDMKPAYLNGEVGSALLLASKLLVAPPDSSSSICVELAQFMTKHHH